MLKYVWLVQTMHSSVDSFDESFGETTSVAGEMLTLRSMMWDFLYKRHKLMCYTMCHGAKFVLLFQFAGELRAKNLLCTNACLSVTFLSICACLV